MVKKIDAYLLPWSFWKCQWRHWFSMVSFCLRHVVHLVTISSICFLRPGHHTESRTLSRNLRLPSCPAWILSRMSNRIYVGMMIVWSFRKTSLDSNNTPLGPIWFQWGVQFWLSGQPSVQNSNRFLHTSSFCWWSLNSSSFLSVAGKFSKMCETYTFHLLLKVVYLRVLLKGHLQSPNLSQRHVVSWTNISSVWLEIFEFLGVVHPGFLNQREAQVVFDRFQLGYLCPGYNRWTSHMPRLLQAPPFRFGRIFVLYWSWTLTRRQQAFSLCCLALAQV